MNPLYIAMLANLTFSTLGDWLAKMWGITNNNTYLYIALAVSLATSYFYFATVKYGGLTVGPSVVLILTMCISVAMGYLLFHEEVSHIQWAGIALGLVSVILILDVFSTKGA
jgi:drug/metabolite transporter (DMT)-like permease